MMIRLPLNVVLCLCLLTFASSCNKPRETASGTAQENAIQVSAPTANATNPYLTKNHLGHPALCWTEELPEGEGFVVKYAVFDPVKEVFGEVVTVEPSKGTAVHPENMNKVAFTAEGTVVAVYSRRTVLPDRFCTPNPLTGERPGPRRCFCIPTLLGTWAGVILIWLPCLMGR
jgi:hypothetical protein